MISVAQVYGLSMMAQTYFFLFSVVLCAVRSSNALVTGKAIGPADIPATPSAATCKTSLDAAAAAFAAAGDSISAVRQIPGANTSHYIFCMDIKTPNDTATIEVHVKPQFVGVPFSQLLANPAYPQVNGFVTACYQAAKGIASNGGYGLASYPWDLSNISNASPTQQKTSLIERLSSATSTYVCGCGISTASVSPTRRMLA